MPTVIQLAAKQIVLLEMAKRGWRIADLARATGLNAQYVTNIVCGNSASRKGRKLIENALGIVAWPTLEAGNADPHKAAKTAGVKAGRRCPARHANRPKHKFVTRSPQKTNKKI